MGVRNLGARNRWDIERLLDLQGVRAETRERLDGINREFYSAQNAAFDATRDHPWPGWERTLAVAPAWPQDGRVLDLGCGNGRFARFLAASGVDPFEYVGLDSSAPLLEAARRSLGSLGLHATLAEADLVNEPPTSWLPSPGFDWIVAFGILHHIPGADTRRAFLTGLVDGLRPNGVLVFAVWRFAAFERFRRRIVPWDTMHSIDPRELEPGDHLLRWGEEHVRYCHALCEEELARLLAGLSGTTRLLDTFDADGREGTLNRYFVLHRTGAA